MEKEKKEEDTEDIYVKEDQKENEVATKNKLESHNNESKECISIIPKQVKVLITKIAHNMQKQSM